ncbi:MAG: trypsin-like peptidase domain-containing protein [Tepidisphaeraceae bacterium]
MPIQIKVISGFGVGREYEFSSDEKEVSIGRAADADVQLHEDDRGCSRGIHARLLAEGLHWFIEADHETGAVLEREGKTLVVARGTRYPIGKKARLTLGQHGPQLRLTVKGTAPVELEPTLKKHEQISDMPVVELTKDLADATATVRPGFRRLKQVIAAVFVIAILAAGLALVRTELTRRNTARVESALRAELSSQRSDTAARLTALKGEIAQIDQRTNDGIVAVLRKLEQSVVMLALSDQKGNVKFIGTGWVVGDKRIATNAHVAEALRDEARKQGLSPVARRATSGGVENVEVQEIIVHPGYRQWARILADPTTRLRPGAANTAATDALIAPYDVAVLRTAQDCGPALPLASNDELRELKAGDELGYVGYPAEGVFDPRSSPPALLTGRIIRLTDFFYSPVSGDTAMLVHHNLATVGGASGSPVVNKSGKVVAINSAGSFVGAIATADQPRPNRIPLGFNYAESVEFVREVLDGSSAKTLSSRNNDWQEKLRRYNLPAGELLDAMATQTVASMKQSGGVSSTSQLEKTLDEQRAIGSGRAAGAVMKVELPAGAAILVQACADDRSDVDLEVASDGEFANIVATDAAPDAYPRVGFVTPQAGTYWVRVYAARTILDHPSVTIRVVRLTD